MVSLGCLWFLRQEWLVDVVVVAASTADRELILADGVQFIAVLGFYRIFMGVNCVEEMSLVGDLMDRWHLRFGGETASKARISLYLDILHL
jgi:hypothetical protein